MCASGNKRRNFNNSGLNNGKTIMVGSHNHENVISDFSVGDCNVNIFSLGEDVYLNYLGRNESGTSFATPRVTATLANYLSRLTSTPSVKLLKRTLLDSAESAERLVCKCAQHPQGVHRYLKLNPDLPRPGLLKRFFWYICDKLDV